MAVGKLPDADLEGGEDALFSEINVTPLTDLFLVLLIIFMVGSTIAAEKKIKEDAEKDTSSGLKVKLPSGEAKEIDPGRNSLVVGIQKNGRVVVNGTPVNEEDLDRLFLNAFDADKNTQVVLKADQGVHHGRVVGVMERAKRAGLKKLAIATRGGS